VSHVEPQTLQATNPGGFLSGCKCCSQPCSLYFLFFSLRVLAGE
jgi:hypothetical protein